MEYIIWGAGEIGRFTLELVRNKEVSFFIDSDINKQKIDFNGYKVYSLEEARSLIHNQTIVISVSEKYQNEIEQILREAAIHNDIITYRDLQIRKTKEKINNRTDYINIYKKAIEWLKSNSIIGEGIINNSNYRIPYPEVTGYFIPSLLNWGYRDIAKGYAKWLCSIQDENGAWRDTEGSHPYIFDSAQVLKGLIAIRDICPEVDSNIIRGCDWIISKMDRDGRLITPTKNSWGNEKVCSELVHIYCISPIMQAAEIYESKEYKNAAEKMIRYYVENCIDEILEFDLLSHFYAYVIEGLIDIGRSDIAKKAMEKINFLQNEDGSVPAYKNYSWVCSTGLFQMAVIWFRLGDMNHGEKAFEYACKLQNPSGGWYGSYPSTSSEVEKNDYFPDAEISWAVKYFLDALYYRNEVSFENMAPLFLEDLSKECGQYTAIKEIMQPWGQKILDAGCGKGRYLNNLIEDYPLNEYYAVDLSENVMNYITNRKIIKKKGCLTKIPYKNDYFDVTYSCEALEHAIDVDCAIREMVRVTKHGGKIAILDKNKDKLGFFEIEKWEQWFDENELRLILEKYCSNVEVKKEISYNNSDANGLFYVWIGTVN